MDEKIKGHFNVNISKGKDDVYFSVHFTKLEIRI